MDDSLIRKNHEEEQTNDKLPANETVNTSKLLSKYHQVDGVYLSEEGYSMIKSLVIEQPKKPRMKRKSLLNTGKEEQEANPEFEENLDEKSNQESDLLKEEEKKKKFRRLRIDKLGIGGFSVKHRGRLSSSKEDEDAANENAERSSTPDALDKPKRKRRISKKKNQLQDTFPAYMQEAFFGKSLLEVIPNGLAAELHLSDKSDDESANKIGSDKIVDLSPTELSATDKEKDNDDMSLLDENFNDLQSGEDFDLPPITPDELMKMIISDENLVRDDEVLDELSNHDMKDVKDEMDILNTNFDLVDTGLPQMDSKDVEDLFNFMKTDSTIEEAKEYPPPPPPPMNPNQMPMLAKASPLVEQPPPPPMEMPLMPSKMDLQAPSSAPLTPSSTDSLTSLQQQFSTFESSNPPLHNQFNNSLMNKAQATDSTQMYWQNAEQETESVTQGQKNFLKWEAEEALGAFATISPVLYANMKQPNLKNEYPVWSDRLKQITKIWRGLSSDQRQPFLQKARENRAANRIHKNNTDPKSAASKEEQKWKELQTQPPPPPLIGDPSQEMCYPMESYAHSPGSKMYGTSPLGMHPQKVPTPGPMMNRPNPTPLQSPMSPAINSPRHRPAMHPQFPEGYQQQHPIPRPTTSMTPGSPSLSQVHPLSAPAGADCYQSAPSTPRPQSTDPQHSFNQSGSPYCVPPRTPSSMMTPFSPNQHMPMGPMSSDGSYQQQEGQNMDMYKVNMPISKPHTPDSYVPSMSTSLPSTPQPPQSPQLPTPSPLNDMYARSPSTPRPTSSQQVRGGPPFDENYNREMYAQNSNPANNYPQQNQFNTYNMNESYPNSPGSHPKVQMRPNMPPNIRPNMPIRRTISDPYARQPMTPMPTTQAAETSGDPMNKQHLRTLLQVHPLQRQESAPAPPTARPGWNGNNFRPPLSPAINRAKMPAPAPNNNQYPIEQQRLQHMNRSPEMRFRQMVPSNNPNQNYQFVMRYPQQQHPQQQNLQKPQQQQWPRMPGNPAEPMNPVMQQHMAQMPPNNSAYSQIKTENSNPEKMEEAKPTTTSDLQLPEEEGLPTELGDDDELLELGNDFNILEYADDELADKSISSGKGNILDEVDEKDMLGDKSKETDSKPSEETKISETKPESILKQTPPTQFNQPMQPGQQPPQQQVFMQNKVHPPPPPENRQQPDQSYFQNLPNTDCFMSDDDFERLRNDFLNDPSDQIQMQNVPPQHQPGNFPMGHQPPVPQHAAIHPPAPHPPPPQQQHQMYQPNQYPQNPTTWQEQQQQQFNKSYPPPNRMHMRMPMGPQGPMGPRHIPNPNVYSQPPVNRMMQQPMPMPVRQSFAGLPPPPPPPTDPITEHDRQMQKQYEQWIISQNTVLTQRQSYLEAEVSKLRKTKKSLNARQRQCRKNQTELSEHDANELARVTQEQHTIQKQLEHTRKETRQHASLIQDYRQKYGTILNLPHSPGSQAVQTSPRSVNSPLAALSTSGPGTPLGICAPSTPQSPSLTSPSPSSLMQNSPMSNLHSPASMMPPSPIHHSPMPNTQMVSQDENNPFSDYFNKDKKPPHMQQQPVYSHMMPGEMQQHDSRVYPGTGYDDGHMQQQAPPPPQQQQQYYHSQQPVGQPMSSFQMQSIRGPPPPQQQQQQQMHFQNNSNNYRFNNPHSQQQQYPNQQINYQQIRRPPPPPYPGNAQQQQQQQQQHYGPRQPYQQPGQIRPPIRQPPNQDCMPNRMNHPMYNDNMMDSGYGMNQPAEQMPMMMDGGVSEAKTIEFTITGLGSGHDNESDPLTFLESQNSQKNKATPNAAAQNSDQNSYPESTSNSATNHQSSESSNSISNSNSESIFIKSEVPSYANSNEVWHISLCYSNQFYLASGL